MAQDKFPKELRENNDIDLDEKESEFYYALGHDLRRKIIKIIGENEYSSFTSLKKQLEVSTGTIYHHLETLSKLIGQKKNKKYYLTDLGLVAYNSLQNNIKIIETPELDGKELRMPLFAEISDFLLKNTIKFEKRSKIYSFIIVFGFLIGGFIFCELNRSYSILLFFRRFENFEVPIFYGVSFLLNFIVFYFLIEAMSRIIYGNYTNSKIFLRSFPIVFFPILLYLVIDWLFLISGIIDNTFGYLINKMLMIFLQACSIWVLSYTLNRIKEIKMESGLIIGLLIYLSGFIIILFASL
ncbi:MAG: hypothetical protein GF317_02580 [Candidatus Lokiarchaeota archaeon]|nr:hypothetical protein [Candidatus Lokiarchaeota archaeon]MBD3198792.1 hypothetical protein [Candidatus Lokiarchaeota archaeon]